MLSGSATQQRESQAPPVDEKLSQFHKELTETCSDILARYAFANYSAVPQRYIKSFFLYTFIRYCLLNKKLIVITIIVSLTNFTPNLKIHLIHYEVYNFIY